MWTGSSSQNGGQNQIDCEDNLTPDSQSIILNPGSDLEVDSKFSYLFLSLSSDLGLIICDSYCSL